MENINRNNGIVLLMDCYSKEAEQLNTTFSQSGAKYVPIVIDSDGFAPEEYISVYESYLTNGMKESGKPRYFNEIDVPDYWEISGTNSIGSVHDFDRERARIYYAEPRNKRHVKIVEWLDNNKFVRVSDHYNKYGRLYARTTFNAKGERVTKSYFSIDNKEIIVENYVTGHVILNYDSSTVIFKNKTEFVKNYLIENGYEESKLYYNSLSYPFFVSQIMPPTHKGDVLFWQEKVREDIPGNMMSILEHRANRTERIMVQMKSSYEKLVELGASENVVKLFGCVYLYRKENGYGHEALVCTNSDQVEHLEDIAKALPNVHIHVAALTEMSSKLMDLNTYDNISLYPAADTATIDSLFMRCDYYLDINRYDEIVDALRTAYLHNHVIFAFDETAHNRDLVSGENIYKLDNWNELVKGIELCVGNNDVVNEKLAVQKSCAADVAADEVTRVLDIER